MCLAPGTVRAPLQNSGADTVNSAGDGRQDRGYGHGPTGIERGVLSCGTGIRFCDFATSHLQDGNLDSTYGPEGFLRVKCVDTGKMREEKCAGQCPQ